MKESWDNKSIPDEFLTFFAELFNIKKTGLIPDIDRNPELLDDSDDEEGDEKFKNSKTEQLKILKISTLCSKSCIATSQWTAKHPFSYYERSFHL